MAGSRKAPAGLSKRSASKLAQERRLDGKRRRDFLWPEVVPAYTLAAKAER